MDAEALHLRDHLQLLKEAIESGLGSLELEEVVSVGQALHLRFIVPRDGLLKGLQPLDAPRHSVYSATPRQQLQQV